MIVCICNNLTTRCVRTAVDQGATSVDEVYSACDAIPKCRTCECEIQTVLDAASAASQPESRRPRIGDSFLVPAT